MDFTLSEERRMLADTAERFLRERYAIAVRHGAAAEPEGFDRMLWSEMAGLGLIGALVLALYINSKKVSGLYENPEVLWIVCPLMLYWIGRLWMRAHRREMRDDPLLFALTDRASYIGGLLIVLSAMVAA